MYSTCMYITGEQTNFNQYNHQRIVLNCKTDTQKLSLASLATPSVCPEITIHHKYLMCDRKSKISISQFDHFEKHTISHNMIFFSK